MTDVAIRVENLGKKYTIGAAVGYKTFRESLYGLFRKRIKTDEQEFWALKNISFEIKRGEVIGIIGRNGAGKSTLLKVLSRITKPTTGSADVYGRVGSLLEVGTGFHPELTGRENIYLNGAILGMTRQEIKKKFDEIIGFAEIEKFLDTPVKRYSSGMYVRLAFAVAAHLEPEILIVDEVLSVGDFSFQEKCLGRIGEISKNEGRTVLFVSHNLPAVEQLCDEVMLVELGQLQLRGSSSSVIQKYLKSVVPSAIDKPLSLRKDRVGSGRIKLTSFRIENVDGQSLNRVQTGSDVVFVFGYECQPKGQFRKVDIGFGPFTENGLLLFVIYSSYTGKTFDNPPIVGEFRCLVRRFPLTPARYRVGARLTVNGEEADWPREGIAFIDVEPGNFFNTGNVGFVGGSQCPFVVEGSWTVSESRF